MHLRNATMNAFVSSIVILVAISVAADAASLYSKSKSSGPKYVLPNEWVKVAIKNNTLIKVSVGDSLEIDCEAVGSPPPAIKWYHQETLLFETGFPEQNEIVDVAIGKLQSRVSISCVMPHHQGVYTCSGTAGSKKKTPQAVTVVVEEKTDQAIKVECDKSKPTIPRITTWAPTLLEFADRDLVLPCAAVGNPAPLIHWINHKGEILDSQTVSSQYKLQDNGDLIISHITWEDMGTYTCVAENALGVDKTETFLYPVKKSGHYPTD